MSKPIPTIDLFAGPGGLGEGFSALGRASGAPFFKICLSIEKDSIAHQTLELRAFFRQFEHGKVPEGYYKALREPSRRGELFAAHAKQAEIAQNEARHLELGTKTIPDVRRMVKRALAKADRWVLLGGPPCQAYSVAGRSRNKGKDGYVPEEDGRHSLYVDYLQVIADHWPAAFVMENVKGLLSANLNNQRIFHRILDDLKSPTAALRREGRTSCTHGRSHRYSVYPLVSRDDDTDGDVADFVVRSERYGIPQARHRVVLLGIRDDFAYAPPGVLDPSPEAVSAGKVLRGLPRLRSGLSENDSGEGWTTFLKTAKSAAWLREVRDVAGIDVCDGIKRTLNDICEPRYKRGAEYLDYEASIGHAERWFLDPRLKGVCNHSTRAHMASDLYRYLFASCYAQVHGRSPSLRHFPFSLLPDHENVTDALKSHGFFADRFRVQLWNRPSTTITSHVAKDGHYYIYPDPTQCRSMTVREVARLQTFPDNYFFCGNRTQQYTQVGNAVPPLLARDIARIVYYALGGA